MYETPSNGSSPRPQQAPAGDRTHEPTGPVTLATLRKIADRGDRFACLTAYDATTAKWLARAGIPLLLVGDSAAQVILGYERTLDMPIEVAVALTGAVKRGAPGCVVMADMPFLSVHTSEQAAVENCGRFMTEGMADIVKIEGDASMAPLVRRLTAAGIPVCAHVGLLPQRVAVAGGYRAAGRTAEDASRVVRDAVTLEQAGAVMLLIEAAPPEVTEMLVKATSVPVIGIGAGPACHGQILVLQDLLGMTDRPPRFAEPLADLGPRTRDAARAWIDLVDRNELPGGGYRMRDGESAKLSRASGEQTADRVGTQDGSGPSRPGTSSG